jgi:starvation-inducible DNA-binding protein
MIETQQQLQQVFRDNFMVYYRAHVAHVNTRGRNFYSDHKLLHKIYEHLQDNTDALAELLRTLGEMMPTTLDSVMSESAVPDEACEGTADDLLSKVRDGLQQLDDAYQELVRVSESESIDEITDYAQGEIRVLRKYMWMLDSTLTPEFMALDDL